MIRNLEGTCSINIDLTQSLDGREDGIDEGFFGVLPLPHKF